MTKKQLTRERYKDPLLKRMKDYEEFADENFIEDSILAFDDVIRIKDDSGFFNYGDGRLNALMGIFERESGLSIQYVCVEKDIWLGVLNEDRICDDFYSIANVPIEEHQRKLELGCRSIEAFAERIDKNALVTASICGKRELLGKFLMEKCNVDMYDDSTLPQSELEKLG